MPTYLPVTVRYVIWNLINIWKISWQTHNLNHGLYVYCKWPTIKVKRSKMSKNWYDRGYVVQENTGPCNSFKDLKHTWMTQPDSINAEPISVCFVNHYFPFLSMIMNNQSIFMPFSIKMGSSFCTYIFV